jgi:hypothetical protein
MASSSSSQQEIPPQDPSQPYRVLIERSDPSERPGGSMGIGEQFLQGTGLRLPYLLTAAEPMDEEAKQKAEDAISAAERARNEITVEALMAFGIVPGSALFESMDSLKKRFTKEDFYPKIRGSPSKKNRDFFRSLSNYPELLMELSKHLPINSLVSLYAISKDFHQTLNGHLTHCMKECAAFKAPQSAKVFKFSVYESTLSPDPVGRPNPIEPNTVRKVPGLRWLQMVIHREKTVRDILACMARQGHRMPKDMPMTLKKMWLLMDIASNAQRVQCMHSKFFSAKDLYNVQMFIVKLDMRFNDPIDGPGNDILRKLMLGQRGLTPLCKMLKRTGYLDMLDVVRLSIRYDYKPDPQLRLYSLWGIPPEEVGVGHLEGWGKGRVHLLRPDELVIREAVRRQLDLKNHIMIMMLWGYLDPITGKDTPATEEEKYMSDDEEKPTWGWNDYEEPEVQQEDQPMTDI